MTKQEVAQIITQEAEKKGYKGMLLNANKIAKIEQSAYMLQRNCIGLEMYVAWYTDKLFVLTIWSNGTRKLSVMENVIMAD